jgi:SusD family.
MAPELCAQYKAEAKFLRAYFYYRLNCYFRGVPLYLKSTPVNEFTKPRSSESEVWEAIVNDLTDVINEPNIPGRYEAGDPNYGRATKGAAFALRGKTYLWMKEYANAESDFRKVGELGFSLFQGEYKQLFKEKNEQCPEMVFSIQCFEKDTYGNQMSFKYGSRVTSGSCWNDFYGDADFIDTYETVEGKPFKWDDYIPGYSGMTPVARSVYFLRDGLNSGEGNFGSGNYKSLKSKMVDYGSDFSKYLDQGNEARIKAVYENRDPRLMQTYITPYSEYLGSPKGIEYTYTLRWPFVQNDISEPFDLRSDSSKYLYYLVRKFVSEGNELLYREYSPIDVPIIRYADVLLSLAEALNEQGKTDEAIPYVNMVRERAGVALLNSNSYTTVAGQDDLRNRIRREKRWELACEGTLYFEELRWGTWYDSKLYDGAGLKQCWGETSISWTHNGDYYTKWPIPATERQLNTALTQNEGWID